MAVAAPVVLLGLVLEDQDLGVLAVAGHRGLHLGPFHHGPSYLHPVLARDQQDPVEGDFLAFLGREALDGNHVALGDPVLLAAGLHDGVHTKNLLQALGSPARGCAAARGAIGCLTRAAKAAAGPRKQKASGAAESHFEIVPRPSFPVKARTGSAASPGAAPRRPVTPWKAPCPSRRSGTLW